VLQEWIPTLALLASIVIAGTGVYVARRAGRWRDSDAAKELHNRVTDTERRLDAHELQLKNLPTKEDIAKLRGDTQAALGEIKAEVRGMEKLVERTEGAAMRLEGYMMERHP